MKTSELIERLRYERDDGARDEAANAIESLQAELAKYRDAPVVAWYHEVEGLSYENHYAGNVPLIIKPGEEK